jgi:dGTPase
VDVLEKDGKGLNLTWEVRDGILGHSKGSKDLGIVAGDQMPETLEGMVVRISDRIAYINHDIDDCIRAEVITLDDLPKEPLSILGMTHGQRIATMVINVVETSEGRPQVAMAGDVLLATNNLKDYMYSNVYNVDMRGNLELSKAKSMLAQLFKLYMISPELAPKQLVGNLKEFNALDIEQKVQKVSDFIAGMTDRYATQRFREHFLPEAWGA